MSSTTRGLGWLACAALTGGPLVNLSAQSAATDLPQPISELPRFTLRQIVSGSSDPVSRIPGPWLRAARAAQPESLTLARYHKVARLSGVAPLEGSALSSERSQHMMGLYRRTELIQAVHQTMIAIRASLPVEGTRRQFDQLFRPHGEWVVDLHQAVLDWARSRAPGMQWRSAQPALAAVRWLDPYDSLTPEAIPRAVYGLSLLGASDSLGLATVSADMRRADSASAAAVELLLLGYKVSQRWYIDALGFFLTQPWVPDQGREQSLSDFVGDDWRRLIGNEFPEMLRAPEIQVRLFGHPQAVPHYGVPTALFRRLVVVQNRTGRTWLDRHGEAGLLRTLRLLPVGDTSLVVLQAGSQRLRLTTVPRQSRESLNGFLEPSDVIAIEPGYPPLLALGTIVHEWQHLLFRRIQLGRFSSTIASGDLSFVELPGLDPYLAEGFAEWSSERILQRLHARWPLLALGEMEKRAALSSERLEDQHSLGYALVAALAQALGDSARTTRLLLANAESPAGIAAQRELKLAWKPYAWAADQVSAVPARRILIPEVTFSVEDGFPDVITSRIIVPAPRTPR